jgi:hypothetical protein
VVTLQQCEAFEANDEDTGERVPMPAGLYLTYDDLPDEGIVAIRSEPEKDTADYGLAKQVYDSLGNEVFDQTVEKLVTGTMSNPSHKATVHQEGDSVLCDFSDGSRLIFLNGFAYVRPIPCGESSAIAAVSEVSAT